MAESLETDLCVIGAGSGGLAVAAGAAQMGARVVLIEQGQMGGDCLNYGCVPSKSLIAAANAAQRPRAGASASTAHEPRSTSPRVHEHVHGVIAAIAPHDSPGTLRGARGARHPRRRPLRRPARASTRAAADPRAPVRHRHRLGAGGAADPRSRRRAASHQRDGLRADRAAGAPDRDRRRPDRLRAGPGASPARRAGHHARAPRSCRRTIPSGRPRARSARAPTASTCASSVEVEAVEREGNGVARDASRTAAGERRIEGSHLLVAAGPAANIDGLDLDAAGIAHGPKGIRSTRACAPATAASMPSATSPAACSSRMSPATMPGIVIRNALFRLPAKVDDRACPGSPTPIPSWPRWG